MFRIRTAALSATLLLALGAPSALAKEGVSARLITPLSHDAVPGTIIVLEWTLSRDQAGARTPFGASGVFVRLLSDSGGRATKAEAEGIGDHYIARAKVPEGGIGGIQIGLAGTRRIAGHTEPADIYFPVEGDDPFAAKSDDGGSSSNVALVVIGALLLAAFGLSWRRARGRVVQPPG
jgi:hypothetical protein